MSYYHNFFHIYYQINKFEVDSLENHEKLNARFSPSEHLKNQIKPMKYNEIQTIKVDVAKKECKLKPGEYHIKKDVRTFLFATRKDILLRVKT